MIIVSTIEMHILNTLINWWLIIKIFWPEYSGLMYSTFRPTCCYFITLLIQWDVIIFVLLQHHLMVKNYSLCESDFFLQTVHKNASFCQGHSRVEHWPPQHVAGYGGAGVRHRYWGCQYSLYVFRHVEDHICMAHWGHGPLQHQLPALRTAQVLVSHILFSWNFLFNLTRVTWHFKISNQ